MTVSHAIVILITLTCQLAPKSNSHISQSFVVSVYKLQHFQCSSLHSNSVYSTVQCNFNFVQQCIQISTRINSSMYIRTSFVCSTLRVSSIRIFILINPIFNNCIWISILNLICRDFRKQFVSEQRLTKQLKLSFHAIQYTQQLFLRIYFQWFGFSRIFW